MGAERRRLGEDPYPDPTAAAEGSRKPSTLCWRYEDAGLGGSGGDGCREIGGLSAERLVEDELGRDEAR